MKYFNRLATNEHEFTQIVRVIFSLFVSIRDNSWLKFGTEDV